MSQDGILAGWFASFRKPTEELEAEAGARINSMLSNTKALKADLATPARTEGNMRHRVFAWQSDKGYKPEQNIDSVGVGTVASEKNTLESYIFWTEQELLKSQGKPYATPY